LLYNESAPITKIIGISLALLAIVLVNFKSSSDSKSSFDRKYLFYPLIIWLSSGIIEITFFMVNKAGIVGADNLEFTGILFLIAGLFGLPVTLYRNKPNKFKNFIGGIALGLPNFFSIYLLLELLDQGWGGSIVFPITNVGIIALTGVIGLILFREQLSKLNIVGLLVAALSIYLIAS